MYIRHRCKANCTERRTIFSSPIYWVCIAGEAKHETMEGNLGSSMVMHSEYDPVLHYLLIEISD